MDILMSASRAPRMNARCKPVIGSIRREVVDHMWVDDSTPVNCGMLP